jgi:hypothetical protein
LRSGFSALLMTAATLAVGADGRDLSASYRPMLKAVAGSFDDAYRDEREVAGGIRVGVVAGELEAAPDLARLNVYLPPTDFAKLCLEVLSSGAQYTAEAEYSIADKAPGVYRLEFPSRHGGKLRRLTVGDLGVLVRFRAAGEGCTPAEADDPVAVVSWGEPAPLDSLSVFLNSGGLGTWLVIPGEKPHRIRCRKLAGEATRIAFDTACSVELLPGDRLEDAEIHRRTFDGFLPPVALRLLVPR